VIAPPLRQDKEPPTSLSTFAHLLEQAGFSLQSFLNGIWTLPVSQIAAALSYLEAAVLERNATPEALRFHLQFIETIPPPEFAHWQEVIRAVFDNRPPPANVAALLRQGDIDVLWRRMLAAAQLHKVTDPETRSDPRLLVRSLFVFLELAQSLLAEDPNVAVVLDAINKYGGLQQYFNRDEIPRATVKKLLAAGYDANYLVFGRQEVLSQRRPARPERASQEQQAGWLSELDKLVTQIVGTAESPPDIDLGVDRYKFLNELRHDREMMRDERSRPAARRVAQRLIPILSKKKAELQKARLLAAAARLDEYLGLIERHEDRAMRKDSSEPAPERLAARRSAKFVPELFFDDTRLGSWLFKPEGIVHGEICRILLDPATPVLELWLEPFTEFMAIVPLYPGFNTRRERCILVETYHYDDRIFDLLGQEETMHFLFEAMLIDAYLGGAERLAIFAAPWGRSAVFADYVGELAKHDELIRYLDSYEFDSVDPGNNALQVSKTGEFHYTESLGYDRPLRGTIDFGYNLVGYGTIDKLTSGRRGVFEIDIHALLERNKLLDKLPAKEKGVAFEPDTPLYKGREEEVEEVRRRERQRVKQAERAFVGHFSRTKIERHRHLRDSLVDRLLTIHRAAFPEYRSFDENYFRERMKCEDAKILIASSERDLLGFALVYRSVHLPRDSIYVDELAVMPEHQRKGVGSALLELVAGTASVRGFRHVYLIPHPGPPELSLIRFYERAHFRPTSQFSQDTRLFQRELSLFGPENRDVLNAINANLQRHLQKRIPSLRIEVLTKLDSDLIELMQDLERVFPKDIRYSREEFKARMTFRDLFVIVARVEEEPIAFILCYQDPILPDHAFFGDTMAVRPDWQGRGIGSAILQAALTIAAQTAYTKFVLFCREGDDKGIPLVEHYKTFGGKVIGPPGDKIRMFIPLRAHPRQRSRRSVVVTPASAHLTQARDAPNQIGLHANSSDERG
jgi:GNAT superfamily N-acetyltransferase